MSDPERDDAGRGLVVDETPRISPLAFAASIGVVWGVLGYSILWEGEPVAVQRPFVQSVAGTLALLPVRAVLWGIHLAERLEHRTFELSTNFAWIAVAAGAVGAFVVLVAALAIRAAIRAIRRSADPARRR